MQVTTDAVQFLGGYGYTTEFPVEHHVVHDDGWTLELDQHRTITIRQPDGTVWAVQPLTGLRHRRHPPHRPNPTDKPTTKASSPSSPEGDLAAPGATGATTEITLWS